MKIVGVTGSIGMGKSTVAAALRKNGAAVWNADHIVHKLLGPGGAAVKQISEYFGNEILTGPFGEERINRDLLGKKVFNNSEDLQTLEKIIHPLIRYQERKFLMSAKFRGYSLSILDIPLLFETERHKRCDAIIVVTAPHFVQKARVLSRPGMTSEKFDGIVSRQMSDKEKKRRADFIINTGLNKSSIYSGVKVIMKKLQNLPIKNWPNSWPV
ncbi:MAG: dephospho-CoA kinase [Rhodospirillaceae bacterium]|nr:dephospho-CoA kinase [Rhodospirillaceae bacterium]|tara:strand:+ start:6769 stop:7407 length:639 start_codon:yes stop_codon:yes gene_type:complete